MTMGDEMTVSKPLNIQIIGVGRMGAEIAYTFMLLRSGLNLYLYEPNRENHHRANAQYLDLLPVAKATGNELVFDELVNCDTYVLCAGVPREDPTGPKSELYGTNRKIAFSTTRHIPRGSTMFVVSNPPHRLAEDLRLDGLDAIPLRNCVDNLRESVGDPYLLNDRVLSVKGFTQFTPAYACVSEILRLMETKRNI